jgi:hypothetical protein
MVLLEKMALMEKPEPMELRAFRDRRDCRVSQVLKERRESKELLEQQDGVEIVPTLLWLAGQETQIATVQSIIGLGSM